VAESLFSPSWYRIARLKPRLRGHAHVHRHDYRGEVWYVLQDHAKGRYYRFPPVAYHLIGQMNGRRTVQEMWERTAEQFGDDAPTQGDVVQLLGQLHSADVLLCDVPPDTAELLHRSQRMERARRTMNLRSPMALRLPLLDPERFLERTVALVRPLFSVWGALLWLGVVSTAAVLTGIHWSELTKDVVDRVLTAENLLLLWLIYPVVKALHEFGHAYAVKAWGGEVHEMGIMLLVLVPVPYVDASAATEFRSKHRRVIVGAAGILVETFLASLALFLWLNLEPGEPRSMAYNVLLIGSVSTLLFNANPLLRFDGYYIFSDLVDIPNLAQRGYQYLGFLCQRYAFGVRSARPPHAGPGERFWFVVYSVASFVYRVFVYTAIVLFIAGKFFFIGVLLAVWAAISMLVLPLGKAARFLTASPVLREQRGRAVLSVSGVVALVFLLLVVVPFPCWTRTEGVIWAPEDSLVRAGTDGFVSRIVATPGSRVTPGQVLMECREPLLEAQVKVLRARLAELRDRYDAAVATDRLQARLVEQELDAARKELERSEERLRELEIRSPGAGVFLLPDEKDLPARYLRRGEPFAYVLEVERPTVRVVVDQSDVDLVRQRTRGVEVRQAEQIGRVVPAAVRREVPEGERRLPSTLLGAAGGGTIAVDPTEPGGTTTFERMFQFDLELLEPVGPVLIGARVHVRFDHGFEPVGFQAWRAARQLFLRRFSV
jgi:putative peptide zinc metalloprotease protein